MSSRPFRHTAPHFGRNGACPCGSGLKFKRCCMLVRPIILGARPPVAEKTVEIPEFAVEGISQPAATL